MLEVLRCSLAGNVLCLNSNSNTVRKIEHVILKILSQNNKIKIYMLNMRHMSHYQCAYNYFPLGASARRKPKIQVIVYSLHK